MKFNKKILTILLFVWVLLYLYSLYIIFDRISLGIHVFGGYEIIFYSLLHFIISFIIIYFITIYLFNKGIIAKIILLILFLFISTNFWYTYNSFPITQNIKIVNNTKENINIIITPIYKFDNGLVSELNTGNNLIFKLFGGGEYGILENKSFEIRAFSNNKEIYFNNFQTNDFLRGNELEPKIIIE